MNVEYINPFIESLNNYFADSMKSELSRGDLAVSKGEINVREFVAIVGFNGAVQGIIAILVSIKTALGIASKFEKKQVVIVDDTVTNSLAEMASTVVKAARENFPTANKENISVTNAAVLRGSEFTEKYPGGVWLEMPFDSPLGELKLRVSLKSNE